MENSLSSPPAPSTSARRPRLQPPTTTNPQLASIALTPSDAMSLPLTPSMPLSNLLSQGMHPNDKPETRNPASSFQRAESELEQDEHAPLHSSRARYVSSSHHHAHALHPHSPSHTSPVRSNNVLPARHRHYVILSRRGSARWSHRARSRTRCTPRTPRGTAAERSVHPQKQAKRNTKQQSSMSSTPEVEELSDDAAAVRAAVAFLSSASPPEES